MASKLERVLQCLANDDRLAVLDAMVDGARTTRQACRRLDLPRGDVSHQIRRLHDAGLIRLTARRPRLEPHGNLYEVTELGLRVRIAIQIIDKAIRGERTGG